MNALARATRADDETHDRAFKALGHSERRSLLRAIGSGERAVHELVDTTGLEQPVASQHLRVLRDAGLVSVRVDGNRRIYSLDFERVAGLRGVLDQFWTEKLAALKATAESFGEEAANPDVRVEDSRPTTAARRSSDGAAP